MVPGAVDLRLLDLAAGGGAGGGDVGGGDAAREDASWLDEAERRALRRMDAPGAAQAFAARRAWRRRLLAARTGRAPGGIVYAVSPEGAPSLIGGGAVFSASASPSRAILAMADAGAIGVDIEEMSRPVSAARLAARILHPDERRIFEAAPDAAREDLVRAWWVAKEALAKSCGVGIDLGATPLWRVELPEPGDWGAATGPGGARRRILRLHRDGAEIALAREAKGPVRLAAEPVR